MTSFDILASNIWIQIATTAWVGLAMAGLSTTMLFRRSAPGIAAAIKASSWPSSHCPECKTPLSWLQRTPLIGWLVSGGRCAYCHKSIPAKYPALEILFLSPVLLASIPVLGTQQALMVPLFTLFYPVAYLAGRGIPATQILSIIIGIYILLFAQAAPLYSMSIPFLVLPVYGAICRRRANLESHTSQTTS